MLSTFAGGRHKSTHNVHYIGLQRNWQFSFSKPPNPDSLCIRGRVLSCVSFGQLFVTLWTVAHQAPLSVGILQARILDYLPYPPPGDLPNPGIKPTSLMSPALAGGFFTTLPPGKPLPRSYSNEISTVLTQKQIYRSYMGSL